MGSTPSKKSVVRVIKEKPETTKAPPVNSKAWEQEDSSRAGALTQEELLERLAVNQDKAREAETRASEANDKVLVNLDLLCNKFVLHFELSSIA